MEAEAAARHQQRVTELAAAARARGQRPRAHIRPRRHHEAPNPTATVNTTDPDSRFVHGHGRTLQGYNAQAVATCEQVVGAAELTQQANDLQQLAPMLTAIRATLAAAGIGDRVQRSAADSGYWSIANVSAIPEAPELLIPPARHGRHGKPSESKSDSLRAAMTAKLANEHGKADYAQRSRTIEPVFGQIKTVQGGWRFMRRGLGACQAEWKLLCGTHNLLKLWRTTPWPPPADRHQPPGTAPATRTGPDRSSSSPRPTVLRPLPQQPAVPLRNSLVRVNTRPATMPNSGFGCRAARLSVCRSSLATAVHGAATPALCWMTLHRACFPSRRRQWFERRPRATTTSGAGLRRFVHA